MGAILELVVCNAQLRDVCFFAELERLVNNLAVEVARGVLWGKASAEVAGREN